MSTDKLPLETALGKVAAQPSSSRSIIESTLADAILDGRIEPGTPLRQEELADMFSVSRMPVREALIQLEARGLVKTARGKGAVVTEVDPLDIMETYGVRLIIEPAALQQSIPHLTEDDLASARTLVQDMEATSDLMQLGRMNTEFHLTLYQKAPNGRLLTLVRNALEEEERFIRFHLAALGLSELGQDDHKALIDAAAAHEPDNAAQILEHHITHASETIRNYLANRDRADE